MAVAPPASPKQRRNQRGHYNPDAPRALAGFNAGERREEIDYVCAEYPYAPADGCTDEPVTHTFASEDEALDFVRKDPERRAYRGAQRRLFGGAGG